MSRKKKKQQPVSPEPTAPGRRPEPAEWLRRGLLGLVTVLIVARPLVLGEDPGLTAPLSDTSNLILTLLWLIAAVGWAGWRLLAREGSWHGGLVEAGLLATVVSVFVSVALPRTYIYRHAALLVSWEWLVFFLALFLTRQLTTREEDQKRVLAALLASVVSVSAYGLYQYTVELPRLRQSTVTAERAARAVGLLSGLAGPLQAAVVTVGAQAEDEELRSQVARRLQEHNHAFATYAHPNSYASFLALLLPALAAATLVRWQSEGGHWRTWLTGGCLVVCLLALWVTHSRGGLLAVFLLAPLTAWFLRPRGSWLLRLAPLAVLLAGLGAGWLLLSSGLMQKAGGGLAVRKDYWQATVDMIADHFWNGVGPGNFGRQYTRYILPQAHETITDPHNFLLELWSTSGFFAAFFSLVALAGFFWLMRCGPEQPAPESGASAPAKPEEAKSEEPGTRWEFYIGGMIGLLLGYLLRELSQSPAEALRLDPDLRRGDEMLVRAVIAGFRSVIWFATFALFERLPWTGRVRGLALAAGVAACLGNLCVSGGISFPSVAQPLWLVAGLALASRGLAGWGGGSGLRPGMIVPVPLAVGFLLGYWIYVFAPIRASESLAISAHEAARAYRIEQAHGFRQIKNPGEFLWRNVVQPMRKAVEEDPIDSERRVQLAQWYNELWRVYQHDPRRFPRTRPEPDQFPFEIYQTLLEAERIDPLGKTVYMTLYQSFLAFAQRQRDDRNRVVQLLQAAEALRRLHERADPRNPRVLYQLAATWREIGDGKRVREYAAQALELNELLPPSSRRLNVFQESALREWRDDPQGGVKPRPPVRR